MHPVLFSIGSLKIYSYGVFTALAMLVAFVATMRSARRAGVDPLHAADLLFFMFVSGVVGARLFFVLQHLEEYRGEPWRAFFLREGGLVWYGGFIVSASTALVYAYWRRWPLLKLCDFFAPVLALAHGVGRLGCFFNGCCFGKAASWGIAFPDDPTPRIPVQLYEAASLVALSLYLFRLAGEKRNEGSVFAAYLFFYGVLRFCLEFLRGDQTLYAGLTLPQWTSLGLVAAGALVWRMVSGGRKGKAA
jgi:phosphatidylglycerol:prolipoprotein diacylglycerol transferase